MTATATLERTLDLARSRLGTVERPGNHVEFNEWYYGYDEGAAWCAAFVSWCLWFGCGHLAPVPASTSRGFTYVPAGVDYAKTHGLWVPQRDGKAVGQPGDLTVFSMGRKRPDHIELLEERDTKPGTYIDIGGNTSKPGSGGSDRSGGGVWRRVRSTKIIGFIRVPYPDEPPADNPGEPTLEAYSMLPRAVQTAGGYFLVGYDAEQGKAWRRTFPNMARFAQVAGGGACITRADGSPFPVTNDQFEQAFEDRGSA